MFFSPALSIITGKVPGAFEEQGRSDWLSGDADGNEITLQPSPDRVALTKTIQEKEAKLEELRTVLMERDVKEKSNVSEELALELSSFFTF